MRKQVFSAPARRLRAFSAIIGIGLFLWLAWVVDWPAPTAPPAMPAKLAETTSDAHEFAPPPSVRGADGREEKPEAAAQSVVGGEGAGDDFPASASTPSLSPAADRGDGRRFHRPHFTAADSGDGYEILFTLGDYAIEEVDVDGTRFSRLVAEGQHARLKTVGMPELPVFRVDLALPPDAGVRVSVVASSSRTLPLAAPLLSAGFVARDEAPGERRRPTTLASPAQPRFPEPRLRTTAPFQIRHYRGVGIFVYPFHYLPAEGVLQVSDRLLISVEIDGQATGRAEVRQPPSWSPSFEAVARRRFINAVKYTRGEGEVDGTPGETTSTAGSAAVRHAGAVDETEQLLLVVPDQWRDVVEPFARWKKQRGLRVKVARYGVDGLTSRTALAAYIQALYDGEGVSHIILLADEALIPPYQLGTTPSDTLYTLLAGNDQYHDAFISRVTANSAAELALQLDKIVDYEKRPDQGAEADWYRHAMFVASDEGEAFSAFGKNDRDLLDEEIPDFTTGGYTRVDRVYDPGATQAQVLDLWHAGRGYILYLGHGSYTTWLTGNLDVAAVHSLANDRRLPFVLNANCENGRFTIDGQCLAEAMIGTGAPSAPAGAVGVVAATSRADWDPPIILSQKFNQLLLADAGMTAGAMTFHSVQAGMDYCAATPREGAAALTRLMEQMHLFGDSTLGLRTRPPTTPVAAHPARVVPLTTFATSVADAARRAPVRGATVCLYHAASDTQIVGRTNAAGNAYLEVGELAGLADGAEFTLTVYANNLVPLQTVVPALLDGVVIHTPASLPPVAIDRDYAFTHGAIGGTPPYTWFADSAPPPGLVLEPTTGILAGTVAAQGNYQYALRVSDADGAEAVQTVQVTVGAAVAFGEMETLPMATVDSIYDAQVPTTGDFKPFSVRLAAGGLPPGLTLGADGRLHGQPLLAGEYSSGLVVADAAGYEDAVEWTIKVEPAGTIRIVTPAELPQFMPGYYGSVHLSARGGAGDGYQWRVVDGILPEGLSLSASGMLAGSATTAGRYDVRIAVEDAWQPPHVGEQDFTLLIHPPAQLADLPLPEAVAGVPYAATLSFAEPLPPLIVLPDVGKVNLAQSTTFNSFDWGAPGMADFWRDDGEFKVPLPFAFPFAGEMHTEMTIGQNGYVLFAEDGIPGNYLPAVTKLQTRNMLAPMWCDILPVALGPSGVFVDYTVERARIRWIGTTYTSWRGLVDVALTLYPDGRIVFHYHRADVRGPAIVGLAGGTGETTQVLLHHLSSQGFLAGWSNRSDLVFTPIPAIPKGLSLSPDGQIQGTPSEAGTHSLSLLLTNQNGYTQSASVTLTVNQPAPADANGDGDVDHAELLAAIDRYRRGLLPRAMLDEAIVEWQNPRSRRRGKRGTASSAPTPVARTGTVLIVHVDGLAPAARDDLLAAGYDVAGRDGDRLLVYCTNDEFEALQAMGLAPVVVDWQFVPDGTRSAAVTPVPGYPTYDEVTDELQAFADAYPELCQLVSLGASVGGRTIWAVKLSSQAAVDRALPEVRLVATIHGDEKLGTVLALRTIRHLLENYGSPDEGGRRATALLDGRELWFVPLLNPDGYEYHIRYNANGIDLNRSFPDGVVSNLGRPFPSRAWDASPLQPETAAIVGWSLQRNFSLCAGLHTGALLIAYPYGNNAQGASVYSATPDDATYVDLANAWVDNHPEMSTMVNAAAWYRVEGEMTDWAYRYLGIMSLTPELSTVKTPPQEELEQLWTDNRPALLNFLEIPVPVLRGRVVDAATGEPLYAEVSVLSIERPIYTHPVVGDYCRLLQAGVYDLEFQAPGYSTRRIDGVAVDGEETVLDVALTPLPVPAVLRRLPADGYTPAREAHIRLDIAFKEEDPPVAAIVSEAIPAGFTFVEAWEMNNDASPAPPLRDDADAVSWLFWEEDIAPRSTSLFLGFLPEGETTGPVSLSGSMLTLDEEEATGGPESWDMAGDEEFEIVLQAGWNAISSPLVPTDADFASLLPAGGYTPPVWQWGEGGFTPSQTMEAGRGYWLLSPKGGVLSLRGTPETRTLRQVGASWTFGGFFAPYAASQLPDGVDAYRWRPDTQAYQKAELFSPGEALWLEFPSPATLDLHHGR